MKKYIELYDGDIKEVKELPKINHNNIEYVLESDFIGFYMNLNNPKEKSKAESVAAKLIMGKAMYDGIDINREGRIKHGIMVEILCQIIALRRILVIFDKDEKFLEAK